MLDIKTIFIANTALLLILSIYMALIYKKNIHNRTIKFITYFVVFYFIGLLLFILRNKVPDFLSIVIANTLFIAGSHSLYLATRDIVGLESKWHNRYWIPIVVVFIGFNIFIYVDFNSNIRMLIYAFYAIIYSFLSMSLFWVYTSAKFKIFDKISVIVFLISFLIETSVFLRFLFIKVSTYYFGNTDIFIYLPNLALFILNLWVIALVKYRIKN